MESTQQPHPPPDAVVKFRLEHGLCYLCGAKCFDVTCPEGSEGQIPQKLKLAPLTIANEVHRGRCLLCQPLLPGQETLLGRDDGNEAARGGSNNQTEATENEAGEDSTQAPSADVEAEVANVRTSTWACGACTFANTNMRLRKCKICGSKRVVGDHSAAAAAAVKIESDRDSNNGGGSAISCGGERETKRQKTTTDFQNKSPINNIPSSSTVPEMEYDNETVGGEGQIRVPKMEYVNETVGGEEQIGEISCGCTDMIVLGDDGDSSSSQEGLNEGDSELKEEGSTNQRHSAPALAEGSGSTSRKGNGLRDIHPSPSALPTSNNDDDPSNTNRAILRSTRSKPGKNIFGNYGLTYAVKYDDTGAFDSFLLNDMPVLLKRYGERLPNLRDRFLNDDVFSTANFGDNREILREAFVCRMRELHAITGEEGCLFKYVPPSIQHREFDIGGETIEGFDTIHNIPIAKALQFVRQLDAANKSAERCLRRDTFRGEWEPMKKDQGFKVFYYRTHDEDLAETVIKTWTSDPEEKHGCIMTNIEKWPTIPAVFYNLDAKVGALYRESFRTKYFLGQVQVCKMECVNARELPASNRSNHNTYSGNILAAHHDPPKEGEVIVTILLAEPIVFRLHNGNQTVMERILTPGSGYCLRCPEGHCFDAKSRSTSCRMKCCPRHGLRHEIECAHPAKCASRHASDSVTAQLPRRRGPRFAAVLRYFTRRAESAEA